MPRTVNRRSGTRLLIGALLSAFGSIAPQRGPSQGATVRLERSGRVATREDSSTSQAQGGFARPTPFPDYT